MVGAIRPEKSVLGGTFCALLCLAAGCLFAGSDPTADPELDQGSSSDAQSGETGSSSAQTAGSHAGSQGDTESSGETPSADSTSEGAPSDPEDSADVNLRGILEFADAPQLDLGTLELGGSDGLSLSLENVGEAAVDIGTPAPLDAPLIWAGGEFPGSGGTCGGLLPPGGTCTVAVAVASGQPGLVQRDVKLNYNDGVQAQSAQIDLDFIAAGLGPNLFANPRADADPPGNTISDWTQSSGNFGIEGGCGHGAGDRCFFAGQGGQSTLLQDVDLSDFAASIDELGLGLRFVGWSESGGWTDDPHDIRLEFFDGSDNSLSVSERTGMDHTNWESTNFAPTIPAGARRLRLQLACDRNWGSNCSAWFDDFLGQLVYPPPG